MQPLTSTQPSTAESRMSPDRRQFLTGALALGALGLGGGALAACGSSGAGSSAAGPATISLATFQTPTTPLGIAYAELAAMWKKSNHGATLTLQEEPYAQFLEVFTTRARAGTLSDVVEMLPGANDEVLFPALQQLTQAEFPGVASALSGWDVTTYSTSTPNKYAGVPVTAQGAFWYYNKALFQRAGLNPDTVPVTWADFMTACGALKRAGIAPIGMSGVDGNCALWAWQCTMALFFGPADDQKVRAGEIKLNGPQFYNSLQPLRETFAAGYWNTDYASKTFPDIQADFAAGKIAIVPGLASSAMNWQAWDASPIKGEYGIFVAPLVPGGSPTQVAFWYPNLMYGISAKSKHTDLARSWISFLASQQGQTLLTKHGIMANRTDVDVLSVTGSQGAAAIPQLVAKFGSVDVPMDQVRSAAFAALLSNLTSALTTGGIQSFLNNVERLQASA
jgi:ABC-type glycerol-3-phosphate transport system substrate-binding protein